MSTRKPAPAKKKSKPKPRKKPAQPEATPQDVAEFKDPKTGRKRKVKLPAGWRQVAEGEAVAFGDAYLKGNTWHSIIKPFGPNHALLGPKSFGGLVIRFKPIPVCTAETPFARARKKGLEIQRKIQEAMGKPFSVDGHLLEAPVRYTDAPEGSETNTGRLGERARYQNPCGGEDVIHAHTITTGSGYFAGWSPRNPRSGLDYFEPGTTEGMIALTRHCLKLIPYAERAQLFAQGGMAAVRRMARRLAENLVARDLALKKPRRATRKAAATQVRKTVTKKKRK